MAEEGPTRKQGAAGPDAVAKWLRERRQALRLSTTELARRVGVSPAFISLVETGRKRPGPETALRIAKALGVPEPTLMAWLKIYDPENIEESWSAMQQLWQHLPEAALGDLPEEQAHTRYAEAESDLVMGTTAPASFRARAMVAHSRASSTEKRDPTPLTRDRVLSFLFEGKAEDRREIAERLLQADPQLFQSVMHRFVEVSPEIMEGALYRAQVSRPGVLQGMLKGIWRRSAPRLPDRALEIRLLPDKPDATTGGGTDSIHVDAALLPAEHRDAGLLAYRISAAGASHAPDALAAGDVVVVSAKCWPVQPGAVYRVRVRERLLFARIAVAGATIIVLPADPGAGVEILPLGDLSKPPPYLLGRIVLVIRSHV